MAKEPLRDPREARALPGLTPTERARDSFHARTHPKPLSDEVSDEDGFDLEDELEDE